MKIRKAILADAPVIADFNVRLALETEELRLDPATVARGVEAILADPAKGLYFVAEHEGAVTGQLMITYEWSDWRNANIWWIQSVYVPEAGRGQGVLRALFEHVAAMARAAGQVCSLRLYMHSENARARHAYERLGLKPTEYQVFEFDLSKAGSRA